MEGPMDSLAESWHASNDALSHGRKRALHASLSRHRPLRSTKPPARLGVESYPSFITPTRGAPPPRESACAARPLLGAVRLPGPLRGRRNGRTVPLDATARESRVTP